MSNIAGCPSNDKPWLKFYSKEVIDAQIPDCSMYEYMFECTKNLKNRYCLNYFGKRITYSEMYLQINKTAAALINMGLKEEI